MIQNIFNVQIKNLCPSKMFFSLFGRWSETPSWRLRPYKYSEDSENNFGGKVFLPQSILEDFVVLQIQPPYTFKISHVDNTIFTHCGVLEFTAEEDTIIVPSWMFKQLEMDTVEEIKLTFQSLERGTHLKLLPHSPTFLEIDNPKLELENVLRFYPTLSLNDEIECNFTEFGVIKFSVVEIEPSQDGAIYTVDTDLSVDFCEPIGYKEKIESEKTVNKYVETIREVKGVKILNMSHLGISFDLSGKNNM